MSSNHSKKAKTEESSSLSVWQDEFAQVRRYLLDCPVVKSDHPAIQSALKGLDQEVRRRERDAKLQSKFVTIDKPKTTTTTNTTATIMDNTTKEPLPSSAAAAAADEVMTDDWHAVDNENGNDVAGSSGNAGNSSSFLGQRLAKASIATIAEHGVRCSTPLEALALILHAAMRSKALGFACTGVPESSLTTTGFAAPIRELPPTQLLPPGWNKNSDNIQLRYRKNGTGALVLQVRTLPNHSNAATTTSTTTKGGNDELLQVQVWLNRANATEPPSQSLEFPLPQHFNLDSWNKSALREKQVAPALHYKALASLLEQFCQTFDLGHVVDDAEEMETTTTTTTAQQQQQFPYVDTTVVNLPTRQGSNNNTAVPTTTTMPGGGPSIPPSLHPQPAHPMHPMVPAGVGMDGSTPTTIQDAFPGLRDPSRPLGGDFAGDLVPGGGLGGGLGVGGPPHLGGSVGPGNLMGPNHPAFFGGTAPPRPGLGMQPRYDPTGPPGGPTDPNNTDGDTMIPGMPGRPGGGRHHPGEPNPDHLRPPNNLNNNNNMFM